MFLKNKTSVFDYLVAGLGNPGLQYEKTRHNVGFMAIDRLAAENHADWNKRKFDAVYSECRIGGKRVLLVKPQTYMNLSGKALTALSSFYKIPPDKMIVMFDDVTLEVGKIRLRRRGSDGGHNGMKDIIELFGTDDIMRIKIGVGAKPNREYDLKDWVLGRFPAEQAKTLDEALDCAVGACGEIISKGIDSAMNHYNG